MGNTLDGCTDGNCKITGRAVGMHTNGGCKCLRYPDGIAEFQKDLAALKADHAEKARLLESATQARDLARGQVEEAYAEIARLKAAVLEISTTDWWQRAKRAELQVSDLREKILKTVEYIHLHERHFIEEPKNCDKAVCKRLLEWAQRAENIPDSPPLAGVCRCWMSDNVGPGGSCLRCGKMPDMKARQAEIDKQKGAQGP